jgi:subtilisin-like proprotein convertase family protein
VTRVGVLALALLALGAAPAQPATKEYSTGNINARIGAHLDESLKVADAGPVSFVRVSFRISVPDTSALALSLVSPKGTVVPVVTHRGAGADFGSDEKGCGGIATVFESDSTTNPVTAGTSPFTDNPYRAEGNLGSLYHEDAKGRWTLEVDNNGAPATLHCLTLDISRVRDLDGGEPEVLLELFTQGAHCCTVVLALRHDARAAAYRRSCSSSATTCAPPSRSTSPTSTCSAAGRRRSAPSITHSPTASSTRVGTTSGRRLGRTSSRS